MNNLALSRYVSELKNAGLIKETNVAEKDAVITVKELTYDDRCVIKDTLFVCKGAHFKEEYLMRASDKGAIAYVSEIKYENVPLPYIIVSDIRKAMVTLAMIFFDNSPSKLTSVGITGTKGKSTTAYYVRSILDSFFPEKCAILSSIDNYDGVINEESHLTTPEAIELHRHFNNAYESKISNLVMEVSSQALKYDRVSGINFDVACFTNIGTDHISDIEHPNFEDYFSSKLKIFDNCKCACINTDIDKAKEVLEYAEKCGCRIVKYGSHIDDDVYLSEYESVDGAIYFTVKTKYFTRRFHIIMPGLFNIYNALAAIAVALVLGVSPDAIDEGLSKAKASGRMELFQSDDKRVTVIVDYAHNSMSFDALYNSVKAEYPDKKIITVFGCPGKKAFLRRHDLGVCSGKNSDFVILTEEDSGEEETESICKDIAQYVESESCPYSIVCDRGDAIKEAILEHFEDKVVLITGKGRETRQKRGTLYIPTPSDVDYTEKFLSEYNSVYAEIKE